MKNVKNPGKAIYVSTLFAFLAIVLSFFPLLGTKMETGEAAFLQSFNMVFGGECTVITGGVASAYSFILNIPLLVWLMLYVFAGLASIFGKNSPENILLSAIFSGVAVIVSFFAPLLLKWVNSSFPLEGITYGPGFYMSLVCGIISTVLSILLYIQSRRFWIQRRAK